MQVKIFETALEMGENAAAIGAEIIRNAIRDRGEAFIILATGASQFTLLNALVAEKDIDWSKCTIFHLDEYVGIDQTHPASFVLYLKQRFLQQVPQVKEFVAIQGNTGDTNQEISRINSAIENVSIDVAFVGIGENSHLAFNDPPADFETTAPYIQVELDEKCRQQQTNEGWFPSLLDVPLWAISMSIRQIMKSTAIICSVPDLRKAEAVKHTIEGEVTNLFPASILQTHPNTWILLDQDAASKLESEKH